MVLESPLDCKEIQSVHPKDQSWVFIGRTDAEAETPIHWPPHAKSWLIGKDHDAGKDWGQEEKGTTEDEMVGWHHRLDGHEFGWTPGVGDGQGGLVCHGSWGHKESTRLRDWTDEQSTNISCKLYIYFIILHKYIKKHTESSPQVWHKLLTKKVYLTSTFFFFFIVLPMCYEKW